MDNRINEIRRKISILRQEMADAQVTVRDLVNHDLDCAEASCRLMAMRAEVAVLIRHWKTAGGGERLPAIPERLKRIPRLPARPKRNERRAAWRPSSP
jgi:hypothetical protein